MEFKTLKKLAILNFIILALPFFQTCSDKNIMSNTYLKNSPLREMAQPAVDSVAGEKVDAKQKNEITEEKQFNYTFTELTHKKRETVDRFLKAKNDLTSSGYGLVLQFLQNLIIDKSLDYTILPFLLIFIISGLIFYFVFKRKAKVILVLSFVNLILLIVQLTMMYGIGYLEDIDQIKFGYYLFIINLLLIVIEGYKIMKIERHKKTNLSDCDLRI